MCGQGIPGMHRVKPEVSVHGEVTDKSCSCCLWLCRSLALPPTFQLLQLFTAGRSPGTFPRAEEEWGEGAGRGGGVGVWSDCVPPLQGTLGWSPSPPGVGLALPNLGNPRSLAGIHPQPWPGEFFLLQRRDINLCSSLIPWPLKQGSQLVLGVMDGLAPSS